MANEYKWRGNIILTIQEGCEFERILVKYNCANPSQFCKKIVSGEIPLADTQTDETAALKVKVAQCERMLMEIKKLLP